MIVKVSADLVIFFSRMVIFSPTVQIIRIYFKIEFEQSDAENYHFTRKIAKSANSSCQKNSSNNGELSTTYSNLLKTMLSTFFLKILSNELDIIRIFQLKKIRQTERA